MSTNTLYLGYHVSSAGGYMAMGKRAAALGANTFAFFTRNPRGGAAAKVEEADVAAFRAWAAECRRFGVEAWRETTDRGDFGKYLKANGCR